MPPTKAFLPLIACLLLVLVPRVGATHPSAQHTIGMLSDAIRADPVDQTLYLRRGHLYSNEGQLELALEDLRKAEELGDPVLAAFDLGVLHYRMGELGAARRYFDVFLERFPEQGPALEYRARVRRDAGDHAGALEDFEAYFALQSSPNPGDYVSAAEMLAGLEGRGEPAALAMLDEGIERLGMIPQLQRPAIELEKRRGNLPAAIDRLEALRPVLGGSPDWKVDMGELQLMAGRPDQARTLFADASRQLDGLRETAARKATRERLGRLEAQLAEIEAPGRGDSNAAPVVVED